MEWKLLTQENYVTTGWSGGSTTQLSIAPEGAVYAQRDFLWRISSAAVELPHSEFTPLPDYDRFLSVLEGEIQRKIDAREPFPLVPGEVVAFDGGAPVESWGKCVDFNLMVRKGACRGAVNVLSRDESFEEDWNAEGETLAVYCAQGWVSLPGAGLRAQAGQLLLCRAARGGPVRLTGGAGRLILVSIWGTER